MNRRFAAWTIAAVAALGLTACSAPTVTPSEPADVGSQTPDITTDPSFATTCLDAAQKVVEAGSDMMEASNAIAGGTDIDPQATVDTFASAIDSLGAAADAATNPEIKAALGAVHDDFVAFGDVLSLVLIDQDYTAAQDLLPVANDIQDSMAAFQDLCTP